MQERDQHDLDAERALLGAILCKPEALDAALRLKPDDFYRPEHGAIFKLMLELREKGRSPTITNLTRIGKSQRGPDGHSVDTELGQLRAFGPNNEAEDLASVPAHL